MTSLQRNRAGRKSRLKPHGRIKPKKQGKGKLWSLKRADDEFRLVMLKSVPHQCVFPRCLITDPKKLTISHYFGRVRKGTRFVKDNCVFLCRNHHYWDKQLGWEFQKQTLQEHGYDGIYTKYMINKLGSRLWDLKILSEQKIGPKKAIQEFQSSLKKMEI